MNQGTDSSNFWQGRWQTGQTGWDMGGPHPLLSRLLDDARSWHALDAGATILEPGAGRAHNGAALARQGFAVTSFDLVPEAVAAAQALYATVPGLRLCAGNALVTNPDWRGSFDAIFDRAVLCALLPGDRRAYLQACFDHLKPGGSFLSLLFTKVVHQGDKLGPPYQITLPELSQLTAPFFALQHAEEQPNTAANADVVRAETVCILRRRPRPLIES